MVRLMLAVTMSLIWLAGCAVAPTGPAEARLPWQDRAFAHEASLVTVAPAEVFRLDAELLQRIRDADAPRMSPPQRLKHLMDLIFGQDLRRFQYAAGHSTTASETWRAQRGDCLSLTVLTYAVAKAMEMDVVMQEVRVPALFDRRGQLDVVNQHVNVLFPRAHRKPLEERASRDVVLDFEPEFASAAKGTPLSESAIVARYYNNIGAEHFANGRNSLAYAHYKAAIQADPGYAASYGNLAVLYRNAGLAADAEQLLRRAVLLGDPGDVPLRALHQLVAEQGRDAEARAFARELQSRRERDPYYWIGLGVQHLEAGNNRQAITALEHARTMANGFEEVHRYLALAYWRSGEAARANEQLSQLAALTGDEAGATRLRKKLKGSPALQQH